MFFLLARQKDIDKIIEGNDRNYVIDNSHVKTTRVPDVVFTSVIFSSGVQNSRFFFSKSVKKSVKRGVRVAREPQLRSKTFV